MLPRSPGCVLFRRCNEHRLLLNSYFSRIGKIESPLCIICGHPTQDTSHSSLSCYGIFTTPCAACFLVTLLFYYLSSRPWGVSLGLGIHDLRLYPPIPRPESGNNNSSSIMIVRSLNMSGIELGFANSTLFLICRQFRLTNKRLAISTPVLCTRPR